jgi:hypothetical protein
MSADPCVFQQGNDVAPSYSLLPMTFFTFLHQLLEKSGLTALERKGIKNEEQKK